jgi:hypothetical protein
MKNLKNIVVQQAYSIYSIRPSEVCHMHLTHNVWAKFEKNSRPIDMIRQTLILTFFLTCLYACDHSNDKILELKQENIKLKAELLALKKRINEFKFVPSVLTRSSRIRLGETYEAIIGTCVYSETLKPIVGIIDRNNFEKVDTLKYNPEDFGCKYIVKPNKRGHYKQGAFVILPTIKDSIKTPIRWEFDVE